MSTATALRGTFNLKKECKGSKQFVEEGDAAGHICGTVYVSKPVLTAGKPATAHFTHAKECVHSHQFRETKGDDQIIGSLYVKKAAIGDTGSFTATVTILDAASVELEIIPD